MHDINYGTVRYDGNECYDWIMKAPPGQNVLYYRGVMSRDRMMGDYIHRDKMMFMADIMLAAAQCGMVDLMQKRRSEDDFLYYARRTKAEFNPLVIQQALEKVYRDRFEHTKSPSVKKTFKKAMEFKENVRLFGATA